MGKRRERRQQQASSRRVKLDLSSEDAVAPSETPGYHEVLGSSLGEKVTAGASNQEAVNDNPLSLLGQYSDDEADEEDEPAAGPANNANFGARKDSSQSQNEQVVVAEENAETAQLATENLSATGNTSADVKQSTDGHVMHDDERLSGNMSTSETWMKDETTENEWQAVLHEDSGEYYYWNIRTGETTWVKPALLERVNAGGSRSTLSQSAASGVESASLVMSSESGQIKDAQGESDALDSIPKYEHDNQPTENCLDPSSPTKDKHLENISTQEGNTSLKPGVDDLKAQMEPVPDASNAHLEPNPIGDVATLREELGELEVLETDCRVGSDAGIQEKVKCETENLQVDEERQEKTTSAGKDEGEDVNLEVVEEIQAVAGTNRDELREVKSGSDYRENEAEIGCKGSPLTREPSLVIETGKEGVSDSQNAANFSECTTSLLGTEGAQITVEENAANFSECTTSLLGTGGAQITVEERRAFLAESGEALQQRLSKLAGDSLGRVSRHALMAIQTKARIADWKVFFSLGFSPEACWSFIQSELKKIKSVLAAEEAAEIGRPKGFQSSSGYEAHHEERPAKKDAEWTLNWGYYQQGSGIVTDPWKQGQPIGTFGNDEDVEEGEIRTSHGEIHTAYANITEGTTGNNNLGVCDGAGGVDVDMEVDMEVDDEIEAEPAVPGMSTDERPSSYEAALPLTNLYTFPGSMDTVTPPDSIPPGEPPHFFPYRLASNSWVPPLPPDEQWAPPPPGETESFPPPPPEEPPPLPPLSPQPIQPYITPSVPSVAQVGYFTSEYATEYLPSTEYIPAPEYQSVPDSSMYSAYVEEVPGGVYSNSPQPTEAGGVEQPYMVASESSSAYNGWTATVLPPTPLSFPSVASGNHLQTLETSALIPSPDVPSIPTVASTTADSSVVTASLEVKKLAKGKAVKKRTHSVAAAPMLNKKVSSLVNKWKQAKEELHGIDEDEDDKALYDIEVLEKKKQKEIEEWRRQQIASGEALENANFQPLGTVDWRERVKRARKADAKKGEAHAEPPLSEVEAQKEEATKTQKPNLTEISKGLPAGWQAYWDEESGEVYYGNLTTQETTWDRPVT